MGLLDGRTALVTGGSRGFGRALCRALASEGANIAFNYTRSEADAAATAQDLQALGRRVWPFRVSVLDKPGMANMVRVVEAEAGGIDVLVNNAGVGQVVPLALMEEEDWDRMMDTHVKGAFITTQAVLRGMVRAQYGRILNIGSLAGVKMMQAPVHYATAKAALKGFSEALAKEVGRYGITVNCLAPGILEQGVSDHLPAAKKQEYLNHCALRRTGTLAEVAALAAFLASEKNSYMNGSTIVVDGGV